MTPLVLFYIAGAFALGGAVGVVGTRNVVHAALFLLVALMGVAGIYLLLFAEFLALVQVLLYGGAIIIVVLFALMLTRLQEFSSGVMENKQWPIAALVSLGAFILISVAVARSQGGAITDRAGPGVLLLGESLFTQWAIPFEVASVLLLVALIGAIVIARSGEGEP
ncbi:MAG: NADH-quinone oxidoreductase subunit J [Chloroflexi bacterium]|nr:NADH-quinone oxidoreductase subunit J [Chloroflexota bacterium]MBI4198343.1 NADH-quinone oxidoreductase subunit J [Chloroflexota bacterium]